MSPPSRRRTKATSPRGRVKSFISQIIDDTPSDPTENDDPEALVQSALEQADERDTLVAALSVEVPKLRALTNAVSHDPKNNRLKLFQKHLAFLDKAWEGRENWAVHPFVKADLSELTRNAMSCLVSLTKDAIAHNVSLPSLWEPEDGVLYKTSHIGADPIHVSQRSAVLARNELRKRLGVGKKSNAAKLDGSDHSDEDESIETEEDNGRDEDESGRKSATTKNNNTHALSPDTGPLVDAAITLRSTARRKRIVSPSTLPNGKRIKDGKRDSDDPDASDAETSDDLELGRSTPAPNRQMHRQPQHSLAASRNKRTVPSSRKTGPSLLPMETRHDIYKPLAGDVAFTPNTTPLLAPIDESFAPDKSLAVPSKIMELTEDVSGFDLDITLPTPQPALADIKPVKPSQASALVHATVDQAAQSD